MASASQADPRWLVSDRADGTNVNAWHWTTKDVTELTKVALKVALEAPRLLSGVSPLLQHCQLENVAVRGDCSINARKGRKFIVCELDIRMAWKGELHGAGGTVTDAGSGTLHLPDVSPECLDDLEVEFTTEKRGTPLSEAMRKEAVPAIRRAVQQCVRTLELRMAEADTTAPPPPAATKPPAPVPISDPAPTLPSPPKSPVPAATGAPPHAPSASAPALPAVPATATAATTATVRDGPAPSKSAMDAAAAAVLSATAAAAKPPPAPTPTSSTPLGPMAAPLALQMMVQKVKASHKGHVSCLRLPACGLQDAHLAPIVELVHSSSVAITELDLSFNHLTDAGVEPLLAVLVDGAQEDLTRVHLGGNKQLTKAGAGAAAAALCRARPDVHVDWRPQLVDASPCCHVGLVYKNSPAARAGLVKGDAVLQWGMLQKGRSLAQRFGFQPSMQEGLGEAFLAGCAFKDVASSISPLVRTFVGMPHEVLVRRKASEAGELGELGAEAPLPSDGTVCIRLCLVPERWSGQGLLGCILK